MSTSSDTPARFGIAWNKPQESYFTLCLLTSTFSTTLLFFFLPHFVQFSYGGFRLFAIYVHFLHSNQQNSLKQFLMDLKEDLLCNTSRNVQFFQLFCYCVASTYLVEIQITKLSDCSKWETAIPICFKRSMFHSHVLQQHNSERQRSGMT